MRNLPHLRFQYAMDEKAREQIEDDRWKRVYRGVEQLQPGAVKFVANGAEYSLDAEGALPEAMQGVTLKQSDIDRQLAWMTEPPEDYSQSKAVIMALAKEHHIPEEEAERLAKAVDEFGNYHEKEKDNRGVLQLRGACLVTPLNFNSFVEARHGLKLEIAHYGDGVSFYHEVSLLDRKIVIDWTHRQFDGKFYPEGNWQQYPYIFSEDQFRLPENIHPSISSSTD